MGLHGLGWRACRALVDAAQLALDRAREELSPLDGSVPEENANRDGCVALIRDAERGPVGRGRRGAPMRRAITIDAGAKRASRC